MHVERIMSHPPTGRMGLATMFPLHGSTAPSTRIGVLAASWRRSSGPLAPPGSPGRTECGSVCVDKRVWGVGHVAHLSTRVGRSP